jgi:hypothetical protein
MTGYIRLILLTMPTNDLSSFLATTKSQRSVSFLIAKDEEELQIFLQALQEQGFQSLHTITEILSHVSSPTKAFYHITAVMPIEIYEFIEQYSSGHISIYDRKLKKMNVAKPSYKDVSIIFLLTKKILHTLQAEGYTFYDKTGLTYQQ